MVSLIRQFINRLIKPLGFQFKSLNRIPRENFLGIANQFQIRTILDIGANEGQFALWARRFFLHAKIHSFEPVKSTFKQLMDISKGDPLWEVHCLALSDSCVEKTIFHHINHSSSSSFHVSNPLEQELFPETKEKKNEIVSCMTLDSWLEKSKECLNSNVLLKLDVQGHETEVLNGSMRVLDRVDVVVVEVIVQGLYSGQARFVDIVKILFDKKFIFQGVLEHGFDADGRVVSLDAVFVKDFKK